MVNTIFDKKGYENIYNLGSDPEITKNPLREIYDSWIENSPELPEETKETHEQTLKKINSIIPFNQLERNLYSTSFFDADFSPEGRTLEDKEGIRHPIINFYLTHFQKTPSKFKKVNPESTKRDYLENVLSHEYGHIIFDENLDNKIKNKTKKNESYNDIFSISDSCSQGVCEAYAFWFGDFISGFKSPLKELRNAYEKHNEKCPADTKINNFEDVINMYKDLNNLAKEQGVQACFDPGKLTEIFQDYEQKIEKEKSKERKENMSKNFPPISFGEYNSQEIEDNYVKIVRGPSNK